jgi:UDP-2,3-diacylglucosamine pyrophosphatase LpxH
MHLGSPLSKSDLLLNFLESTKCDNLYIVGDFIDFYHLYEHHGWSADCNKVIKRLLSKVGKKTMIRVCVGNHDAFLGLLGGFGFGSVSINHEFIHENKFCDYLVTHGDKYDIGMRFFSLTKMLCFMSLHLHWLPFVKWAKRISDKISSRNMNWGKLRRRVLELELGGSIVGHTHTPEYKAEGNTWNCGDWVEHCTAVVESDDHEMSLLNYRKADV